jgi:hypothetical protein
MVILPIQLAIEVRVNGQKLMGRWIHRHATYTILVRLKYRDWLTIDGKKVLWLRPQTRME